MPGVPALSAVVLDLDETLSDHTPLREGVVRVHLPKALLLVGHEDRVWQGVGR